MHRSTSPVKKPYGTRANRIFADRTKKTLVGLPVLLDQPFSPRRHDQSYGIHEQFTNHRKEQENQDVVDIAGGKISIHHKITLEQCCEAKSQKDRVIATLRALEQQYSTGQEERYEHQ